MTRFVMLALMLPLIARLCDGAMITVGRAVVVAPTTPHVSLANLLPFSLMPVLLPARITTELRPTFLYMLPTVMLYVRQVGAPQQWGSCGQTWGYPLPLPCGPCGGRGHRAPPSSASFPDTAVWPPFFHMLVLPALLNDGYPITIGCDIAVAAVKPPE